MIVRAVVEKLATDDGLVQFAHQELGREYLVEVESIRRGQTLVHWHGAVRQGELVEDDVPPLVHTKDIIFTVEGEWIPLECIRLCV